LDLAALFWIVTLIIIANLCAYQLLLFFLFLTKVPLFCHTHYFIGYFYRRICVKEVADIRFPTHQRKALSSNHWRMSTSEEDALDAASGLEGDLFGSDDEEPAKVRELSDQELDSGDDEGRDDRAHQVEAEDQDGDNLDAHIMETTVWRHPLPKPVDGEVRSSMA
jgi:hypothetical protein